MSLKDDDQAARAVATAPRVALPDIEKAIESTYYLTGAEAMGSNYGDFEDALHTLTLCIVVMRNGFVLIGKSAPASPANYDQQLGRKFALEDAMRQAWPLMGFALRDRLWRDSDDALAALS